MNRPEVYHKSVQILYDAYFNDTLRHLNCYACAVGNLIAGNNGWKFKKCKPGSIGRLQDINWGSAPSAYCDEAGESSAAWYRVVGLRERSDTGELQVKSTGYSIREARNIEFAFEKAEKGLGDEGWMYNGLVAVLEVLKQIHEVTDEDLIQANHKRFKEHHERKLQTV
jgi:hypothetical protein